MKVFDAASYETFWKSLQNEKEQSLSLSLARACLWFLVPLYQGASLLKRAFFAISSLFRTRVNVPAHADISRSVSEDHRWRELAQESVECRDR